jgi:hypothetical protein
MIDLTEAFFWLERTLWDLRLSPTNLYNDCLDESKGKFIHTFGLDFLNSLLDLTDDELRECHPQCTCPISYSERQELKKMLLSHSLKCSACTEVKLYEEARNLFTEDKIRKKLKPRVAKKVFLHP